MSTTPTVYSAGARNGLVMGLYLSLMFLLQAYGTKSFMLLLIGDLMLLGVPVLLYRQLVRGFDRMPHQRGFAATWLNGIITFLGGSLVLAFVIFIFLRFLQPGFIMQQMHMVIDAYHSLGTPQADEIARIFEQIIEQKALPTPASFAMAMLWFTSFTGAMLSLVIAAIIKYITRKNPKN